MSKPSPSIRQSIKQLLWHGLMGTALGVLCAGLLLQIGASHHDAFIDGPETMAARLRFLLTVAFLFGIGSTLTGATLIANDKAHSQSSR